jgi:hypothetical protein
MTERTATTLELVHTMMDEAEAVRFLEGQRISLGGRTMDPKAQIVGEFVKSIRVPGYFPPLAELRQQLRTMVSLMDVPAPALPRIEDITIPGPAGAIPARVYDPVGKAGTTLPAVAYFHGGGWVQGDLESHHGICARLALHSGALVVAVDYRLAPEHKFPAAVEDSVAAYRFGHSMVRPIYRLNTTVVDRLPVFSLTNDPTKDLVLNPAAWTNPPAGQWGTAAGYYGDYRYQRRPTESMSLGREFRIRERSTFQIRAEFTNIFNRTEPVNPVSNNALATQTKNQTGQTTAGFGYINVATVFSQPRQGTLVARFSF